MLSDVPHKRAGYTPSSDEGRMVEAMLFADGGSRGNPGPAASAAVLLGSDGVLLEEISAYLGEATNNVAEWTALLLGLEAARKRGIHRLVVRLDSELVVRQLRGEYRVKHSGLQPLYQRAVRLLEGFEKVEIGHVPREENTVADRLVNRVLDQEAHVEAK